MPTVNCHSTCELPPYAHPTRAAILPVGRKCQLSGEEDHLETLVEALAGRSEAWYLVSLHSVLPSARSHKPVVEVRWHGQAIGRLSPAMSAHFTPIAERCEATDKQLLCYAKIAGNALRVDAEVFDTRAGELPQAWIDSHLSTE